MQASIILCTYVRSYDMQYEIFCVAIYCLIIMHNYCITSISDQLLVIGMGNQSLMEQIQQVFKYIQLYHETFWL